MGLLPIFTGWVFSRPEQFLLSRISRSIHTFASATAKWQSAPHQLAALACCFVNALKSERRMETVEQSQPSLTSDPGIVLGMAVAVGLFCVVQRGEPQDGNLHHDHVVMKTASHSISYSKKL